MVDRQQLTHTPRSWDTAPLVPASPYAALLTAAACACIIASVSCNDISVHAPNPQTLIHLNLTTSEGGEPHTHKRSGHGIVQRSQTSAFVLCLVVHNIPADDVLARTTRSTAPFSILFLVLHADSWISAAPGCLACALLHLAAVSIRRSSAQRTRGTFRREMVLARTYPVLILVLDRLCIPGENFVLEKKTGTSEKARAHAYHPAHTKKLI